ncbi:MAG: iron-sulfur cluster-binding protein [Alphaproteobacteria bacterium]|nr:iron-sulfur cluster-binding protein [Alphaproteobacteria bacterium]MDE2164524.1 iron-sulfur cluster-binding protein [Alphaproteobacteria bacterium]MDE2266761.1 iron-sulfur cluster-binding protein [Alphaproteobacteria bacterium]
MINSPRTFPQNVHAALGDARLRSALSRLKSHFSVSRRKSIERYGDFETLRDAGRDIRNYALDHLDTLLETFELNVVARGGRVHWARTPNEARQIILDILRESGAKTVTKGKTMVSEEIELNPYLEANGITPVETDLGEYIVQLRQEPPSHIIAPAFHLHKEQVAETFREAHKTLDPDRPLVERNALVAEARTILRNRFETADAGITGANFLSAADGAAVIVTNEGNGDLTRLLPKTHIVLTGIEKVVSDLNDVAVLLRLLTRSATGQEITTYVSVMAGPRESKETDGPENFHVVLLDHGRSDLLNTEAQDVLRCIRCSACINHCPVYITVGGHAYGTTYPGPLGAALNPGLMGMEEVHHHPNASTLCGRCAEVCPVRIPLPKIMRYWRAHEYAKGLAPIAPVFALGLWAFVAKRPALYKFGARVGARILRLLAGRKGTIHAIPIRNGWFAVRDFPAPQGKTFMEMWRKK